MPNKAAKVRKQQRLKKNKELQQKGRTRKQYKKWLKKQQGENHGVTQFNSGRSR